MTTAGTSLLLRSATKYLGVSKYHAMAEVGPSHAESSSQRSAMAGGELRAGSRSPPTTHGENCVRAAGAVKKKAKHVTVRRLK